MVDINFVINRNHKYNENYTAEKILNSWWKKDYDLVVFRFSQCLVIGLIYSTFIELNSDATKPMQNTQHSQP